MLRQAAIIASDMSRDPNALPMFNWVERITIMLTCGYNFWESQRHTTFMKGRQT